MGSTPASRTILKPLVSVFKCMKTVLPWLLFLASAVAAGFFYNANRTKATELEQLRTQVRELESLPAEIEQLKQNQVAPEELARLKSGQEELLRLRNQVRQLTAEKTQLTQQAQAAQSQARQAQAQVQQAQAQVQEAQAQAVAQAQQQSQAATAPTCIAQLRQLAEAKIQWAVENQRPANSTPTQADLAAYFPNNAIPPCPGGGQYTLGNVSALPTCSVADHVLAAQ